MSREPLTGHRMNGTDGRNADAAGKGESGPVVFLLGVIAVGILVVVLAAVLLRKPVATNPFDAPPAPAESTSPAR